MEPFRKETHTLSLLIAQNVHAAGLDDATVDSYLRHPEQIIPAIRRGFTLQNESKKLRSLQDFNHEYGASFDPEWTSATIRFYREFLRKDIIPDLIKFDYPKPAVPGYEWFVFCPQGLTLKTVIDGLCRPQFSIEIDPDFDLDFCTFERSWSTSNMVLCQKKAQRMDAATVREVLTESQDHFLDLRERLVLEAVYRFHTGQCLDDDFFSHCPRSRFQGKACMSIGMLIEHSFW
jgi:hypothetical protein